MAAVDFSNDTVTALVGVDEDEHGIVKGYASGNLSFTPNVEETKYYALNGQRVVMARDGKGRAFGPDLAAILPELQRVHVEDAPLLVRRYPNCALGEAP